MPLWVKMIWTAFVVLTVAMALYTFLWIGTLAGGCGNDMLATIPSPSGGRKLVFFSVIAEQPLALVRKHPCFPRMTHCEAVALFALRTPITGRRRAGRVGALN